MSYIGPLRDLTTLVGSLTPETLPRLVRDLLASRGHEQIRITDGPGDGCRDLHSMEHGYQPWLTQCKYHRSTSQSVSSREIAELAIGLVKFGHKHGLFVTTARISPQAKRELLSDYPGFSLDFLDGADLLAAVLDNAALTALWFDGERLAPVNTALSIPAILRDLSNDVPLPFGVEGEGWGESEPLKLGIDGLSVELRFPCRENVSRFEPYRAPRRRSLVEGMSADLVCGELVVTGIDGLGALPGALRTLGERILLMESMPHAEHPIVALRFGKPAFTPLNGTSTGARVVVDDLKPLTFVRRDKAVVEERAGLVPSPSSGWGEKSMARTSQINAVRLYHSVLDACAALEIVTAPGEYFRWMQWARQEKTRRAWEQSLFVLHASDFDPLTLHSAEHDDKLKWIDGRTLYGWFHEYLLGGADLMPTRHHDLLEYAQGEDERDAHEVQRLAEIRQAQAACGEVVPPALARHMVALVGTDPLPTDQQLHLRTADILADGELPSPVDPRSIAIRATMCWRLDGNAAPIDAVPLPLGAAQLTRVWVDDLGEAGRYLVVHLAEPSDPSSFQSSESRFNALAEGLRVAAQHIEANAHVGGRATADYWMAKFFIDCRGVLPPPNPDNPADWLGPPGASTPAYFELMEHIMSTPI